MRGGEDEEGCRSLMAKGRAEEQRYDEGYKYKEASCYLMAKKRKSWQRGDVGDGGRLPAPSWAIDEERA